jgi:carboxyl-terminal processing protease
MSNLEKLRNYIVWEPLLLAVMIAIGMIVGYRMAPKTDGVQLVENQERSSGTLEQLLRFVESRYVDDVDAQYLTEAAITSILHELDPHSQYISNELKSHLEEDMQGRYFGIGVEKIRINDSIFVITTMPDSPAEKAGIRPGDRIVNVADTIVVDSSVTDEELQLILKGELGTSVTLTVETRTGEKKKVELERAKIAIPSVDLGYMVNDSIGYIKINRFSNETYKEFMQVLEGLAESGMDDIIIDLRGNPGGYLQETVKILSQLIEDKESLLVYTEGEHSKRVEYKTSGRQFYSLDDIVILIDVGSASASEILAGALQDLDRGLVVGRRSFGKGLVQEQFSLSNGTAVRLTTARYFTPSGRLIQRDYSDIDTYFDEGSDRMQNGELTNEESMPVEDSTEHFTRQGRVVYGGGGILPDIFVPTSNPFPLEDWAHINYYIGEYVVWNLDSLIGPTTVQESFLEDFNLDNEQLSGLIEYLTVKFPDLQSMGDSEKQILAQTAKAQIGKMKFNSQEIYYKILNETSEEIAHAIELIKANEVDILLSNVKTATLE